jgi:hypothetical protein
LRQLLHTPDIHLFNFAQADAYARRVSYLNKLTLPRGGLDLGKDIPETDTQLIGPTVELIAREGLHPALSDLLLEAAREVHGKPGLFKKAGEFPVLVEHEIRLSPDAQRYYASGKSLLYRTFPFWLAGLVARALAVILPLVLLLIPALKVAPPFTAGASSPASTAGIGCCSISSARRWHSVPCRASRRNCCAGWPMWMPLSARSWCRRPLAICCTSCAAISTLSAAACRPMLTRRAIKG